MDGTVLVVMGVSGVGKSTVGRALAAELNWPFLDADQLHSPAAIAQMSAGIPLADTDRAPWLARVAAWIDAQLAGEQSGVVACSALRRAHRDALRRPNVLFVYLAADPETIARRLHERQHFMPASLLASQFETLEAPGPNERAITVRATQPLELIVASVLARLPRLQRPNSAGVDLPPP